MSDFTDRVGEVFILFFYAHLLLLLSWPFFLWLEKRFPVDDDLESSHYWFNWKLTLMNWVITPVFSALVVTLTLFVSQALGMPLFAYPFLEISIGLPYLDAILQLMMLFFTACFLTDLWYYWWHRWQHKIPFLWELHKIHHSDERLNTTTMPRSHFLENAGQSLVRGLSVGLLFDLSSPPNFAFAVVAAGLLPPLWNFFIHSNVRLEKLHGLLPYFSTPQYHRVHHSRLPQHQDTNFAIWFPLFDILFGSYYRPGVKEYPPTGLSSGERIDTLRAAQLGPIVSWWRMLMRSRWDGAR